jgi:hypothetical protein
MESDTHFAEFRNDSNSGCWARKRADDLPPIAANSGTTARAIELSRTVVPHRHVGTAPIRAFPLNGVDLHNAANKIGGWSDDYFSPRCHCISAARKPGAPTSSSSNIGSRVEECDIEGHRA